ncbi:MAG: helix-turn-helix domain-containing protein [Gammaproteobacteria bacterium]|nr:helix-turn-helix domain-containing protein [Gammaproteobacteria bacterium]
MATNNAASHTPSQWQPASHEEIEHFAWAFDLLKGKWKKEILWLISLDVARFGELRRHLRNITPTMLTTRLRELESDGLITRITVSEKPLHVKYELTNATKDLGTVFEAFLCWASKYEEALGRKGGELANTIDPHSVTLHQ